ncbi:2,3-bisphosphoglycerate-independent phosphoglycerate mutase [Candidatus Parcubacteria bacterium]|nr:2,3-bisphosphoglycerate-independent phosphoglycerate mutase [Candidatus Parcubacteria bacterium]
MLKKIKNNNLPLILIILDGWGIDKANKGNAITLAKIPVLDFLFKKYPFTKLRAHGKYVGLPVKQVGNSEAGHMNIGAGRLVEQDVVKISRSIKDGTFFKNSAFLGAIRHVHKMNSKIHVMGMLSNGQSPHSDPKHFIALLSLLKKNKVENVSLHLFTDGRDSPQYASLQLVDDLEKYFFNNEKIATIMGRFYAMDRKKKWERTEKAYDALVLNKGRLAKNAQDAITQSYNRGDSDEFIEPCVIGEHGGKNSRISDGDSVIFFNLRSDRSRQLAKVFVQNNFDKMNPGAFNRKKQLKHLYFVAMTDFGPDLDDILTAYPGIDLQNTLPMALSGLRQLYIAETEKYAHVTYFLNGGYSGQVGDEDQYMIPSPDVKSYDQTPAMSSEKLSKKVIDNLCLKPSGRKSWKYDFTLLNFAAPDMVGHTGNIKAGIKCCEAVDKCVSDIVEAYLKINGTVIITADHGNVEKMLNLKTGEIHTEHTVNPVPFVIINKNTRNIKLKRNGILGDIAPTVLKIVNKKIPKEMTGKSLF